MLSGGFLEAFRRDGFVVIPGIVSTDELEESRRATDSYMSAPSAGVIFRFGADGRRIHCKIPQLVERDETFRRLAQHPTIVGAVEDLLGSARIFRDVVIAKPPANGAIVHFHQDAAYWDVEPADRALSAWIALDDAPKEAGCLEVVPGSHRYAREHALLVRGWKLPRRLTAVLRSAASLTGTGDNPRTARERLFAFAKKFALASITRFLPTLNDLNDLRVDPQRFETGDTVPIPARAGDVIFFSSWLIHGSGPNTSEHLRRAYIVSYMAQACRVPGREISHFLPARSS